MILKAPLVLLVVSAWIASFYAAAVRMQDINWGSPIVFTIIVGLYVWGMLLSKKE